MNRALLFSKVFTLAQLQQIQTDCANRILSGQGQSAFVSSSSAGGRSAAMLQNYSSEELLEIVVEAQQILAGTLLGIPATYISFGGTY